MELTQALDILNQEITDTQEKLDILLLAKNSLEESFSPEFTTIQNAQDEVVSKIAQINAKDLIIAEKDTIIAEKEVRIKELEDAALVAEEPTPAEV